MTTPETPDADVAEPVDQDPPEGNDAGDAQGDPAPPEDTASAPMGPWSRAADPEPAPDYGWYRCPSCGNVTPAGARPTGPQVVKADALQADRVTQRQHGPCPTCVEAAETAVAAGETGL